MSCSIYIRDIYRTHLDSNDGDDWDGHSRFLPDGFDDRHRKRRDAFRALERVLGKT